MAKSIWGMVPLETGVTKAMLLDEGENDPLFGDKTGFKSDTNEPLLR